MHTITIKSSRPMVLISAAAYDGLTETVALLSANPALPAELKAVKAEMKHGQHITLQDFRKKYQVYR
jgi:PHD/YefM family antitoxin component YafN of YafNO toxin-antitoxin module